MASGCPARLHGELDGDAQRDRSPGKNRGRTPGELVSPRCQRCESNIRRREECEQGVQALAQWDPNIRALRDVPVDLLDSHVKDLPVTIWKRCSHVIRENQRTLDAARALTDGDLARVGVLMRESHNSLRDLYEVSCRELDIMVESAEGLPGFCGGRMTGGGFGGCTVNLVREENAAGFATKIAERYRQATGITPQVYLCSAEDGAQKLS